MKKYFYLAASVLLAISLISCKKNSDVQSSSRSSENPVEITFKCGSETGGKKTSVNGTKILWSSGDKLYVYNNAGNGATFTMKSDEYAGTPYAEFTGSLTASAPYFALCWPYSNTSETYKPTSGSATTMTFVLPAEQNYSVNGFDPGAMPSAAVAEDVTSTLQFRNLCGALKLQIKGTEKVSKIVLKDKGGKDLSGIFTVSPSDFVAASSSTTGATVTLNCGEGVQLNESTATEFWVVVPAGVFASGFEAEITASSNGVAIVETSVANTIERNGIKTMPAIAPEFKVYMTDQCGIKYPIVTIGNQVWMGENLRCNKYSANSDADASLKSQSLPKSDSETKMSTDASYANASEATMPTYMTKSQMDKLGYLYNFAAAIGSTWLYSSSEYVNRQGICPDGWHLPTAGEWETLRSAIEPGYSGNYDNTVGQKLKTVDGWQSNNGENTYGFSALPAGLFNIGSNPYLGTQARFWTSTPDPSNLSQAGYVGMGTGTAMYIVSGSSKGEKKGNGQSVRCVRNN